MIPALGESWSHAATNRVELFWNNSIRNAKLVKSPSQKVNTVPYAITRQGIRHTETHTGGLRQYPEKHRGESNSIISSAKIVSQKTQEALKIYDYEFTKKCVYVLLNILST